MRSATGRPLVASSKELTEVEAAEVLRDLAQLIDPTEPDTTLPETDADQ